MSRPEVKRSGTSLDLIERANNNRNKVLREQKRSLKSIQSVLAGVGQRREIVGYIPSWECSYPRSALIGKNNRNKVLRGRKIH
jgi:hypothetical protein